MSMMLRRMMRQMNSGAWNMVVITNPAEFRLGGGLFTLLQQNLPSNVRIAVGFLDEDLSDLTQVEAGTCYEFVYDGDPQRSMYRRVYQNAYAVNETRSMVDTYLCVAQANARFVVYYQ